MAVKTARDIIQDVQVELQDVEGIRWPAAELVNALNDGQRAIVEADPLSTAAEVEIDLVPGARQTIPGAAHALLEVIRNAAGRRGAITQIQRAMLDATDPFWASRAGRLDVEHFMADARRADAFEVYPPALAGSRVLALLSMTPADVPAPSGVQASSVANQTTFMDERFANALRHYVLFRAYSKDAEFSANSALAASHKALFDQAIGADAQAAATAHPSTTNDPTT